MCIGPCIVAINEEEEPTTCYLVFYYYTYDRLNMFRASLCPSSGAHDYISDYHMVSGRAEGYCLQPGHLANQPAPKSQPSAT
jgi:hypothetical protein